MAVGSLLRLPAQVSREELDAAATTVGEFGIDNRAGIPGTLHRISALRSRSGAVVGLTCRVGRAVSGHAVMVRDILEGEAGGCGIIAATVLDTSQALHTQPQSECLHAAMAGVAILTCTKIHCVTLAGWLCCSPLPAPSACSQPVSPVPGSPRRRQDDRHP